MNLRKLANYFVIKYDLKSLAVDHLGVDPLTNTEIKDNKKFKPGDTVLDNKSNIIYKVISYITNQEIMGQQVDGAGKAKNPHGSYRKSFHSDKLLENNLTLISPAGKLHDLETPLNILKKKLEYIEEKMLFLQKNIDPQEPAPKSLADVANSSQAKIRSLRGEIEELKIRIKDLDPFAK